MTLSKEVLDAITEFARTYGDTAGSYAGSFSPHQRDAARAALEAAIAAEISKRPTAHQLEDMQTQRDLAEAESKRLRDRTEMAEAKAAVIGGEWCRENRAAGRGPCGSCSLCCKEQRERADAAEAKAMRLMGLLLELLEAEEEHRWAQGWDLVTTQDRAFAARDAARAALKEPR